MESTITKPRRAWLAALLSLCGSPLGQVYAGRIRRSVVLWMISVLLFLVLILASIFLPLGLFGIALLFLCMLAFPLFLAVDAYLLARRNRNTPLKSYQKWWMYILFFFAFVAANHAVAYAFRFFIAEAFVVPSRAMSPTIMPGDRILVDKLFYNHQNLQRNDVVVFRIAGPHSPFFVMRLVGLPGDYIEIVDEKVILNGKEWDDQHAVFDDGLPCCPELTNFGPLKIPADSFFVLGDNRRISKDSRIIGPIPLSDLHGKARMIYWAQERRFPDPRDTSRYELGPIDWKRMGTRLD